MRSSEASAAPMKIELRAPSAQEVLQILGLAVFVWLVVTDFRRLPAAEEIARNLESELSAIEPPPGARLMGDYSRMVKATGVVLTKRYAVHGDEMPAREYLRRQFLEHGWSRCEAERAEWCKGAYRASLYPRSAGTHTEIAVVMSWR